jgi:hypothetical protein
MIAGFSVAAVWVILSGTRHPTAQNTCVHNLYTNATGSIASEGTTLCNVFAWVDLGVMAGLWVLLLIVQVRLRLRLRSSHLIGSFRYTCMSWRRRSVRYGRRIT